MRIYHSTDSLEHAPTKFYRRGAYIDHPETAERYTVLRKAVTDDGYEICAASDQGLAPLLAVHTSDYIEFISQAWNQRAEIDANTEELLTTQFARPQMHRRPNSLLGLLGYYTADTSTPIRSGTWNAVYGSAQAAVCAADEAFSNGCAYALCRPPGHHTFADCAGGFCYLNNSAVAAQRMRSLCNKRVAIVDIDVHHGNGTQGIFYERDDVLTISIHADPSNYFPFFAGYADESGAGAGLGFNRNLPLAHGSGDVDFLAALDRALGYVSAFAPAALVVALGLDASEEDPLGVLKITTEGFARAARAIAGTALPTAIIQEGGYLCPALPRNLLAFLDQFR